MVKERVELRLRFKEDEDLPPGEWLWAERVRANDRGGTYRLLNSSVFAPVAVGDLVRAASDGGGGLQITDLLKPSDRVLTAIEYPTTAPGEDIRRIADSWTEGTDGWSEGTPPVLFTIWAEGMRAGADRRGAPAVHRRPSRLDLARHGPPRRPDARPPGGRRLPAGDGPRPAQAPPVTEATEGRVLALRDGGRRSVVWSAAGASLLCALPKSSPSGLRSGWPSTTPQPR